MTLVILRDSYFHFLYFCSLSIHFVNCCSYVLYSFVLISCQMCKIQYFTMVDVKVFIQFYTKVCLQLSICLHPQHAAVNAMNGDLSSPKQCRHFYIVIKN